MEIIHDIVVRLRMEWRCWLDDVAVYNIIA